MLIIKKNYQLLIIDTKWSNFLDRLDITFLVFETNKIKEESY